MRDAAKMPTFRVCVRVRSVREVDGNVRDVIAADGFTPGEANHFPVVFAVWVFCQPPANNAGSPCNYNFLYLILGMHLPAAV
jgi:hypothetical protein